MMSTHSKFWPLDFDQESEIYDNPSWNLPGRRKKLSHIDRGARPARGSSQAKISKA
jgi:hypothetical protein